MHCLNQLGRPIVIYLILGVIFCVGVDFKRVTQDRQKYLLGIFFNGAYKNYNDGIVYFDYMRRVEPEAALHFANLGECYFQLGKIDDARRYFQEALKREPQNKKFQYQLQRATNVSN